MATKVSAAAFAQWLQKQVDDKCGYIMGSYGQDPKKWDVDSWWFTQYSGAQKEKALYWREHAPRVFDCQGCAEGYYLDETGINVNTKARYAYAEWCGVKGSGMIPASYRVPGAAVYWGDTASSIHHVAFLVEPVDGDNPDGDWYLVEARGVMYGVVKTKLYSRKPNYWGLMTKYYEYENVSTEPIVYKLGDRTLRKGDSGEDVAELQQALIEVGYKLPKYGADGDYGSETVEAVKALQRDNALDIDGIYGPASHKALTKMLDDKDADPSEDPDIDDTKPYVEITAEGRWNIRLGPGTEYGIITVVSYGDKFTHVATAYNDWACVQLDGAVGWISPKCCKVVT